MGNLTLNFFVHIKTVFIHMKSAPWSEDYACLKIVEHEHF